MLVPGIETVVVTAVSDAVVVGAPIQSVAVALNSRGAPGLVATTEEQGPAGPPGLKGEQGPPGAVPTYTAGMTLSGHRALMFQADDTVVPADPNSPGYVFAGISLGAAQSGASVAVEDDGQIVEPSWAWMSGLPVFALAGGLLTQTPPTSGVLHIIGFAVNATTLRVAPQAPITFV